MNRKHTTGLLLLALVMFVCPSAIEAFPTDDVEGFRLYSSWTEDNPNPDAGFTRVDHDRYQWIVDMREWLREQRRGS